MELHEIFLRALEALFLVFIFVFWLALTISTVKGEYLEWYEKVIMVLIFLMALCIVYALIFEKMDIKWLT